MHNPSTKDAVAFTQKMTQKKSRRLYFIVVVLIVIADQITKWLASHYLGDGFPVEILPVFDLRLAHNAGAAFSFLSDAGGWQRWLFTGISSVVSVVLVVWLYRLLPSQRLLAWALVFVLGGALGNLYDRAAYGYVIDFISVHWQQHYFPTFNVADAAITLGAGLLLLDTFLAPKDSSNEASSQAEK